MRLPGYTIAKATCAISLRPHALLGLTLSACVPIFAGKGALVSTTVFILGELPPGAEQPPVPIGGNVDGKFSTAAIYAIVFVPLGLGGLALFVAWRRNAEQQAAAARRDAVEDRRAGWPPVAPAPAARKAAAEPAEPRAFQTVQRRDRDDDHNHDLELFSAVPQPSRTSDAVRRAGAARAAAGAGRIAKDVELPRVVVDVAPAPVRVQHDPAPRAGAGAAARVPPIPLASAPAAPAHVADDADEEHEVAFHADDGDEDAAGAEHAAAAPASVVRASVARAAASDHNAPPSYEQVLYNGLLCGCAILCRALVTWNRRSRSTIRRRLCPSLCL